MHLQVQLKKTLQSLNKSVFDKFEKLFRNSHAIAKASRPLSDFTWIARLDDKKGIDVGQTYRNVNSCKEFLVSIAVVERKKIEQQLKDAKMYTIMSDGSRDVSVIENKIVYIHFALNREVHCYFVGVIECEHDNGAGIFAAILKADEFEHIAKDELYSKIIAFVANILMIKCMSYRIELAFKDAMKSSTL